MKGFPQDKNKEAKPRQGLCAVKTRNPEMVCINSSIEHVEDEICTNRTKIVVSLVR